MTNEQLMESKATIEGRDLDALVSHIRAILDIQDRKHGFPSKTYLKCFVGSEAVQALVDTGVAHDSADALRIGNIPLSAGAFHHVQHAHTFKDEYLFYRFTGDEDHGALSQKADGRHVSWADFTARISSEEDHAFTLQPAIPERDTELATFTQDDLDSCGVAPLDQYNAKLLDCTHPKAWEDPMR